MPVHEIKAIASSSLIGFQNGKPRAAQVGGSASQAIADHRVEKAFANGRIDSMGGALPGVTESQMFEQTGRVPRPRSKNPPRPASLVDYQNVPRNEMDNLEPQDLQIDQLILHNDEALKQFQYLEKSLTSFHDNVTQTASKLRQPAAVDSHVVDLQASEIGGKRQKKGESEAADMKALFGAPPIYLDMNYGGSSAANALSNIFAEGDPEYCDPHLISLDPIIVEGEGYLYGIRSMQVVVLKETVRGNDFVSIASGPMHSMAITAGGQLISWGANDMLQLGYIGVEEGVLGIEMDPRPVTALSGHIVVHAACGKQHTVVLTEQGELWAWGCYLQGQVGIEVQREKFSHGHIGPTPLSSFDSRSPRWVACGHYHTCIIDGLGDLWSCGSQQSGAHGHEDEKDEVLVPQLLASISGRDFRQVLASAPLPGV